MAERYLDLDPSLVFLILDEDFLLNKTRAMQFRECVVKGGKKLSIFAFSSIKAISPAILILTRSAAVSRGTVGGI